MERSRQYAALVLIAATQQIIKQRRKTESMCEYPPEYGGDELLLQRIDEFLADASVQHELEEAIAFSQKMS